MLTIIPTNILSQIQVATTKIEELLYIYMIYVLNLGLVHLLLPVNFYVNN